MVKGYEDIILSPIVTEKSMTAVRANKYTFKVKKDANKFEIKKAVENLFKVDVKKVNTMHVRGPKRTQGAHSGYRPSWKKAIVTLKDDSKKIEFFETMI